ncbi:hypothetical protein GF314_04700 [bacterium]|nr:hypothetical protein [bacterium]
MDLQPDFRELLALFGEREIEFLIVGGFALAHHGAPRFTGDLDLLVRPTPDNAARVLDALDAFGFGSLDLSIDDFTRDDSVVQLGLPPVRIDLLTSLSGVDWETAWRGRETVRYGDIAAQVIGRSELVANKRALGRTQDLADIEALGE